MKRNDPKYALVRKAFDEFPKRRAALQVESLEWKLRGIDLHLEILKAQTDKATGKYTPAECAAMVADFKARMDKLATEGEAMTLKSEQLDADQEAASKELEKLNKGDAKDE